jgi:hypothetical protein
MVAIIFILLIPGAIVLYGILRQRDDEAHNQRLRDAYDKKHAEYMEKNGFENEQERSDYALAVWESEKTKSK